MKLTIALIALAGCVMAETSPFYLPIRNNDLVALRKLIADPGPKARDARGQTALMYSAALGSLESMKMLLDAGADPNAVNDFGATPLMWCAGDAAKVRLLLAKGANVNARSKLGRTPLAIAATYGGALEVARLLIEKGADINATDEGGSTILEQSAASNNLELARMLIARGADVNAVDAGGFTALINAAGNGDRNAPMVKLLLEHGAKVNLKSGDTVETVKNGQVQLGHLTALHEACGQANFEAVEALVKAGSDVNAKDVRNATPLIFAVATDHANPKIVELLLKSGAAREPALDWARRYQNPAILALLGLKPEPAGAAAPNAAPVRKPREAIAMALAASQPRASHFLEAGGCVSCHAEHLNGLAVSTAKPLGIPADYALEQREARVTATLRGIMEQQLYQVVDPPPGVDGMQFSVLQIAAAGVAPTLAIDSLAFHIAAMQRKEGDWPNYGFARPPIEDGGFSHTANGIRVLTVWPIPGRKAEFDARIARAADWLEKAAPVTTEDRSMQILGLAWAGRKAPANRLQQLISCQRADGGWGQTPNLPSDAYATGEVLWTLHESGMAPSDPVFRKGEDFLLRTQQADGTWHVRTRSFTFQPYFESGFPYHHDQWISQSGTALAAIALSFAAK